VSQCHGAAKSRNASSLGRVNVSASTALLTDHYELTMLQAALRDGTAHRPSVFELFSRRLSGGRRYGVLAGLGRFLDALERFRFGDDEIGWLREAGVVDDDTLEWLAAYRFGGTVWGYPEGELYFPGSPVLIVEGTFAECVVIETLALSILNHDSAIASAAARMISAAGDRPCIEMGSRRTQEWSAVAAARAAYVAGFAATSNLEAGRTYGIPTTGTSAHSFTLLHDTEREAFAAQVAALGPDTTLLVDTYDIAEAVTTAVDVAGGALGGVRLDSGDLVALACSVREQLDELGATSTRIIVTSDLDEHAIAALAAAPVDGYGVGTALVTGSGVPTSGFVYKLVSRADDDGQMVPVAKKSKDKVSVGGRKYALRRRSATGIAQAEVIGVGALPADDGDDRPLLVELWRDGKRLHHATLDEARARLRSALAELPHHSVSLKPGDPVIATTYEEHA
jgi:nicotinate phosphoribosyltransferase